MSLLLKFGPWTLLKFQFIQSPELPFQFNFKLISLFRIYDLCPPWCQFLIFSLAHSNPHDTIPKQKVCKEDIFDYLSKQAFSMPLPIKVYAALLSFLISGPEIRILGLYVPFNLLEFHLK